MPLAKPAALESINNRLLHSLPRAIFKRLRPSVEFQTMSMGDVITRADQPIDFFTS
jgi:hypothetical protein